MKTIASEVNGAARAAGVPFWLDVQTVKGRDVVLSHRVEGTESWRAAANAVELLRLRRVDRLNVSLGILGQAYLGELHDAPEGPCLSLVALLHAAYLPKARATPHLFAGRLIARTLDAQPEVLAGLGDGDARAFDEAFPEAEPVALARSQCAAAPPVVRERVAGLWRTFYGGELPLLTRVP